MAVKSLKLLQLSIVLELLNYHQLFVWCGKNGLKEAACEYFITLGQWAVPASLMKGN